MEHCKLTPTLFVKKYYDVLQTTSQQSLLTFIGGRKKVLDKEDEVFFSRNKVIIRKVFLREQERIAAQLYKREVKALREAYRNLKLSYNKHAYILTLICEQFQPGKQSRCFHIQDDYIGNEWGCITRVFVEGVLLASKDTRIDFQKQNSVENDYGTIDFYLTASQVRGMDYINGIFTYDIERVNGKGNIFHCKVLLVNCPSSSSKGAVSFRKFYHTSGYYSEDIEGCINWRTSEAFRLKYQRQLQNYTSNFHSKADGKIPPDYEGVLNTTVSIEDSVRVGNPLRAAQRFMRNHKLNVKGDYLLRDIYAIAPLGIYPYLDKIAQKLYDDGGFEDI